MAAGVDWRFFLNVFINGPDMLHIWFMAVQATYAVRAGKEAA